MKTKLTDSNVQRIKAPQEGRLDIHDTVMTGFGLRVSAGGNRSYFVVYRVKGDRTYKLRRYTIGAIGLHKLADARKAARDVILEAKSGVDPLERKQTAKAEHARDSFSAVSHEFIERYCKVHQRSWKTTQTIIRSKLSKWDNKNVPDINRRDVLAALDKLMDSDAPYMANRTLAVMRKFFNWAIERGVIDVSPATKVKAPGKEMSRDRVLTNDEIKAIWKACGDVGYPFGAYVQIALLTGQRRGEVVNMRREDIDGGTWHIPQTKNDKPHSVPLTDAAQAIINELPVFEGPFVFSTTGGAIPFAGFSKYKTALDKAANVGEWRLHDLRRTAATGMAGLGVAPHIVERILNHTSGVISGVAAAYNRHSYETEMRTALEAWARQVKNIVADKQGNKVVPMVRK